MFSKVVRLMLCAILLVLVTGLIFVKWLSASVIFALLLRLIASSLELVGNSGKFQIALVCTELRYSVFHPI